MDKKLYTRFSISYLIRIKINNKFLLVKNSKIDSFQPVGGCYKYFDSAKTYLTKLQYIPERIVNGKDLENDFRIFIPNHNVEEFIKWYKNGSDRELDFLREFNEELFDEKILSKTEFGIPVLIKVANGSFETFTSQSLQMPSVMPMDIIELHETPNQKRLLKALQEKTSDKYIWATRQDILNGFILQNGVKKIIGNHTPKIL